MDKCDYKHWWSLSIDKSAIIQYVLIYIMIQYIGGRVLEVIGTDIFYGGTLVLCALLIVIMPQQVPLKKRFFGHIVVLGCSLMVSFAITDGALSIGTILSILSRVILVYVAVQFDTDHFILRFIKMVFVMACISLIEFVFVQIVGPSTALGLFSHLYQIRNGVSWLGSSYGLFFVSYNFMDPARNAYMFGEPGEYQILLIAALYFMTFFNVDLNKKKKTRYYIMFIITLLTTQSTTGYFNLLAVAVAVLIIKRDQVNPTVRKIILGAVFVLILYMIFGYSQNSFLYKNFFSKILSDSNTLDLAVNTGAARVGPIERFINVVKVVPHKFVFGVGYNGLSSLLGGYSACGLINSIAMIGIFSSLILYGKMFASLIRYSNSWLQVILGLFIVINMGLSQPDLLAIMSVLICMYGDYSGLKSIKGQNGFSDIS